MLCSTIGENSDRVSGRKSLLAPRVNDLFMFGVADESVGGFGTRAPHPALLRAVSSTWHSFAVNICTNGRHLENADS